MPLFLKRQCGRTLGEHAEQTFDVEQGLVYSISSRPGAGLLRTALAIEAPHSNQLLADRVDESKHGAGAHHIEWDAPQTEDGVTIQVESLQGAGEFHVDARAASAGGPGSHPAPSDSIGYVALNRHGIRWKLPIVGPLG